MAPVAPVGTHFKCDCPGFAHCRLPGGWRTFGGLLNEGMFMAITVAELAQAIGGVVVGEGGGRVVDSCNTLVDATEKQVSLFHMAKYAKELETTRAGCVIVAPGELKNVRRAEGLGPLTAI